MIIVQILEADDVVEPNDWCRPLSIVSMSGGHSDYYSFKCQYSGRPENNVKWVRVKYILGQCWNGLTVKELDEKLGKFVKYEFIRGDIPKRQQLSLSGYNVSDHSRDKDFK